MKRKIAVLGGGAASLFAVWELMKTDPSAYDITVYQMGWRLGGKCASGRRSSGAPRIEEHGFHVMFGFYENVFRVVREAYQQVYPDKGADYWKHFFKAEDTTVGLARFADPAQKILDVWSAPFPSASGGDPGDPNADDDASVWLILKNIWVWFRELARDAARKSGHNPDSVIAAARPAGGGLSLNDTRGRIDALPEQFSVRGAVRAVVPAWEYGMDMLDGLSLLGDSGSAREDDVARFDKLAHGAIEAVDSLEQEAVDPDARLHWRGLKGIVEFVATCARGMFKDLVVLRRTWFELEEDFRAWILRHHGQPESPPVKALYDLVFARRDHLAAGPILQAWARAAFLFKGGAIFKMQVATGEAIFAPLYLALHRQGVKFQFFHKVEQLQLSADKKAIESITFELQASPKEATYDPIVYLDVDLGGPVHLACWPDAPLLERLDPEDARRIRNDKVNLESRWPKSTSGRKVVLTRAKDEFHEVILGISVAALPDMCGELIAADPKFARQVSTFAPGPANCATQALQIWTRNGKTPLQPRPIIGAFSEPYDTVADMDQLLAAELWPGGTAAGLRYMCSSIEGPEPSLERDDYPDELRKQCIKDSIAWLNQRAPVLWRNLATPSGRFDWSALYTSGPAKVDDLDEQWVSTPANLSDRYVIPTPGSHEARLKSNETKFENLYLAGDWTRTSLSIGCLESAVMGGLQAARAISLELGTARVPRARGDWIDDVEARPRAGTVSRSPNTPTFRQRDGDQIGVPPFDLRFNDLFLFVLRADSNELQRVCDQHLNLGPERYSPLGDFVIVYGSSIDNIKGRQTVRASEAGFWIPVGVERGKRTRLFTYTPYIWLDSDVSARVGRMLYGYPKQVANVLLPRAGSNAAIVVNGEALVDVGRGNFEAKRVPLMRAVTKSSDPWQRPSTGILSQVFGVTKLFIGLARQLVRLPNVELNEIPQLFTGLRSVLLRQFPGAPALDPPVYQALVEASIDLDRSTWRGRVLDPADWIIDVPSYVVPRIASTLGLAGTDASGNCTTQPLAAAWMTFEGTLHGPIESWRR